METMRRSRQCAHLAVFLLACTATAVPTACAENIVIRKPPDTGFVYLQSLSYDEARAIAAPFLSKEGRLGYLPSKKLLIIHDFGENIDAVRGVLKKIDTAPVNVRIDVVFDQAGEHSGASVGLNVNKVTVRRSGGRTRVKGVGNFSIGAGQRRTREVTHQFILTISGHAASLWVGREVADLVWIREYGTRHGWWREELQLVNRRLGASLEVRPRVLPDGRIEVSVYPRLTSRGRDPLSIDIKEAASRVIVNDGQTVRLGGLDRHKRETYKRLFGIGRVFDGTRLTVTLTPHILHAKTVRRTQGSR